MVDFCMTSAMESHSASSVADRTRASSATGEPLRSSLRRSSLQRMGVSVWYGRLCRSGCQADLVPCKMGTLPGGLAQQSHSASEDMVPQNEEQRSSDVFCPSLRMSLQLGMSIFFLKMPLVQRTLLLSMISQRARQTSSLLPLVSSEMAGSELASVAVMPRSALSSMMTWMTWFAYHMLFDIILSPHHGSHVAKSRGNNGAERSVKLEGR